MALKSKDRKILAAGLILTGTIGLLEVISVNTQAVTLLGLCILLIWIGKKVWPPY